jgi:cytoskeletal protein RodZ
VPTPQDDLTVGVALRAAREDAGRTVEQLASRTNIRATLIRDLEEDRFGSCGGRVYARGHVKSIASALGVDAAPLLALFDKAQPDGEPALPAASPMVVPGRTEETLGGTNFALASAAALRPERRGPRWGLALAGAAAVLGVVTFVGYQDQPGAADRATVFDTAGPTPSATATRAPVVTPPTQPDLSAAKPPVTGAQLRLRVIGGQSWVSVSNATATLFEGILSDGQFRDFSDPTRLKVVVGNAGAVNLNCGGRDSGPAGGSGKVGHFACTAAGLTAT